MKVFVGSISPCNISLFTRIFVNIFTNSLNVFNKNANVVTKKKVGTLQLLIQLEMERFFFLVIMMDRLKKKYTTNSLKEKTKTLQNLHSLSNKEVANKFNSSLPPQNKKTLSS